MSKIVFVYGTLKRGYGNNRLLSSAKFLGTATTCDDTFFMYSNGGFPYVLRNGTFFVKGELYELLDKDTEEALDWLEGVPSHYIRHSVTARLDDGALTTTEYEGCVECEMYVASDNTAARVAKSLTPIVPNDDNILEWSR